MNMKLTILAGVVAISACAGVATNKYADLKDLQKNVVAIHLEEGGTCSGWVLKATHTIVTAAHCKPKSGRIAADFGDGLYHEITPVKIGDEDWKSAPDLMTLESSDPSIKWPNGLPICPFKPYYGEVVVVMGSPLSVDGSMSWGRVAKPSDVVDNRSFIQLDGRLLPGNSGGPAIDLETGCVIGVGEFIRIAAPKAGVPFGMNYLTPADQLKELA